MELSQNAEAPPDKHDVDLPSKAVVFLELTKFHAHVHQHIFMAFSVYALNSFAPSPSELG